MCIYMNSAVLVRENVAEKMFMRKAIEVHDKRRSSAWYPRGLYRKSFDRKTSAQSYQKVNATFTGQQKHFFIYLILYDSGMCN